MVRAQREESMSMDGALGERKRRERDGARAERRREGRLHCMQISWSSVRAQGVCRPIQIFASVIVQQRSGQSKRVGTIIQAEQQNGRKLRSGGRRE
eukprot:3696013-Rhodomonas_salina.1